MCQLRGLRIMLPLALAGASIASYLAGCGANGGNGGGNANDNVTNTNDNNSANDNSGGSGQNNDNAAANENDNIAPPPASKYAALKLAIQGTGATALRDDGTVTIAGNLDGTTLTDGQLVFISDEGQQTYADMTADGLFNVTLDPAREYHVALLQEGHFSAPVFSDARDASDAAADGAELVLSYYRGAVTVVHGPVQTVGDALVTDASNTPVGAADGISLVGLTSEAAPVTGASDDIDADRDGIPAPIDADKDGDGIIDLADTNVPAGVPVPQPGDSSQTVSGAFVFNNLKMDVDQLVPPPTLLFANNDYAVVTVGWQEKPTETPVGYTVSTVEAVSVPAWSRFGFASTIADWTIAPGQDGYTGYPLPGRPWTGELYTGPSHSSLWQVWVQSPKADSALAAAYPDVVAASQSVPLNWDLGASGVTANVTDFYALRITYTDGVNTQTRFAYAQSLFSFRTPAVAASITTSTAITTVNYNDVLSAGHPSNPIVYPDDSTLGDVTMQVTPPKFDVAATTGVITGALGWRFDIFYYDGSGTQIGSVQTTPVTLTFSGAALTVTVPEALLDRAGSRTDMDGDGANDLDATHTSSDIVAYKIDLTTTTIGGSDNTGLFFYFVADSQQSAFTGFGP